MTNAIATTISDITDQMVESAVASLGAAFDVAVAADGITVAATLDAAALDGAFAGRSEIGDGARAGALITVLPASGLQLDGERTVDPAALADALAAGAAATIGEAIGATLAAAPPQAVAAEPAIAASAPSIIKFSVGTSPANLVTVYWVVEASLDALMTAADPVIPAEPSASSVAPANLPELVASAMPGPPRDLNLLSDVRMNVTVELGRAVMAVRELLSLREGSIVELDRAAGAAVDVLVNGTLVARGEVVVIDDELGVRVTELVER